MKLPAFGKSSNELEQREKRANDLSGAPRKPPVENSDQFGQYKAQLRAWEQSYAAARQMETDKLNMMGITDRRMLPFLELALSDLIALKPEPGPEIADEVEEYENSRPGKIMARNTAEIGAERMLKQQRHAENQNELEELHNMHQRGALKDTPLEKLFEEEANNG